jgi:hypothetical protein
MIRYFSLRCDFVVHSDLGTSIQVCMYLLYSFVSSSFKKKHVPLTHGRYSHVNVSSSLITKLCPPHALSATSTEPHVGLTHVRKVQQDKIAAHAQGHIVTKGAV